MNEISARVAAFRARYGAESTALPEGPWNAVIASLLQHRSVRAFQPKAVPPGTLEMLVAAAQSAASSSNMQAWSVVAVTDPATKAEMARIAGNQAHIVQCPLFFVWVADVARLGRVGEAVGQDFEALPYLETFLFAAFDAILAAQNATVAAESMGLSTVYIGALRNDVEGVAKALGLPPGTMGVVGLCVGYADESETKWQVKPRLPQSAVLHRERYDTAAEPAANAAYDRALQSFSAASERNSYTWTERVISRVGKLRALAGRDRIRAAMERLGLPLR
ncbi:NADPH-dependent oxidoreductase [Acidisphaera sp. L21]|uniref:NADPH-dependent oxidoreductase n=1 Tax=Acidisphaera sp. L21 TaxID=1641851 RepID=UPI00131DDAE6|nr:NADPH-dependent oxidoreductase [Acidisphaera sp. L21]